VTNTKGINNYIYFKTEKIFVFLLRRLNYIKDQEQTRSILKDPKQMSVFKLKTFISDPQSSRG
jgi:hypothetical protein